MARGPEELGRVADKEAYTVPSVNAFCPPHRIPIERTIFIFGVKRTVSCQANQPSNKVTGPILALSLQRTDKASNRCLRDERKY
jgi:hypothetical protein